HLAAGRCLARGEGLPETTLSPGVRDNQAWLYDLLCYAAYAAFGPMGLALGKVLLVVGLALVLLCLGRAGQGWYVAAACTALALLAMSLRLLLQPVTVSCFFLALTLWSVVGSRRQ